MKIQVQVDAEEFWPSLDRDLRSAKEYAYVQSLSFEGDEAGQGVALALETNAAKDCRIIADEFYTIKRVNDKFLGNPKHWFNSEIRHERQKTLDMFAELEEKGVRVKLTNPPGLINEYWLHRNHKKIIAIDDHVSYLGGINFADHNFEWHDMMLRIEDSEVTEFLRDDFRSTWEGVHANTSRKFGDIEIFRFDGRTNRKAFEPIMDLIASARESVVMISPYMTFPFFDVLKRAKQNGATTTLITPQVNNWKVLSEYVQWEANRYDVDIRLYQTKMLHLKAILIDDKYLIVGSSNFDFLSWQLMQEIVAVVTDPAVIKDFKRRIVDKDLAESVPSNKKVHWIKGYYHKARFKILGGVFTGI